MNKILARLLAASWTYCASANSFPIFGSRHRYHQYRTTVESVESVVGRSRGGSSSLDSSSGDDSFASSSATPTTEQRDAQQLHPVTVTSVWGDVAMGPPDAILGIAQAFRECKDTRKVNICVGAYRDSFGNPWILPTVQTAEELLLRLQKEQATGAGGTTVNKEYLPIEGDQDFIAAAVKFAYGATVDLDTIAAVQTLSGTGACRIGAHFLERFAPQQQQNLEPTSTRQPLPPQILIPVPTWGNHWKIFEEAGLHTTPYRYYDSSTNSLDWTGLVEDLQSAPDRSIVLLHACAHNPTGCDPDRTQWMEIARILRQKRHICFFDSAYQGFASGDAESDAWALRYVVAQGDIPVLLAQSFAKNFGLYGERCGTLSVVCADAAEKQRILSQLKCIIRPMYSSPPKHGSSIVKTVLQDEALTAQYYEECRQMSHRSYASAIGG
jgi:aspartate aminotransferase, mitochondrial